MVRGLKIEKVMTRNVITIDPAESVRRAEEKMQLHGIRHLPVTKRGELVGMISDRDIKVARFFTGPGNMPAEKIMSIDLVCAPDDALVTDVVYAMLLKKINAVPILKEDGRLAGIFTSYDLLQLILERSIETSPVALPA